MAFKYADRVRETSTSTGTGTFSLAGAVTGFQTFLSGIGASNTLFYSISHRSASEWEVGYGTLDALGTTLTRTSVIASSNSGSAVTFSAGTKDVFVTLPADQVTPPNLIPGGRLSLSSSDPVPSSDLSAQGTLYYLPFMDSKIEIYTGNRWVTYDIGTGISLSLTGLTSATNYDVFAIVSGGSPALATTAWSTATARATALTTVDGVYVQSGTTTRRYLGTIRTSAASQCSDTAAQRFVHNYYHRQRRPLYKRDGGVTSYTYASTTYQQARAQSSNKCEIVCGVSGAMFDMTCHAYTTHGTAGQGGITAIGYDAVDFIAPAYGSTIAAFSFSQVASQPVTATGRSVGYPAIGFRTLYWIERIFSTGTVTFFNGTDRAGIQGWWEC
jgi:hypothetical protein